MQNANLKFYKYPDRRDIVFVFGAGASYADGAPLQDELLPIILSGELIDIEESETGKVVRAFIRDNFAWDIQAGVYPTMESVFGFLDYFINQDEHLSAGYPNTKIHAIKEGLIKLIHYVIGEKSNRRAMIYRSFWESVLGHAKNISILTLNYDTLLEKALMAAYQEKAFIDYCIHLMNYELPGGTEWQWFNPREPLVVERGKNPLVIKIMKAHGSLNWKYCRCCGQVLLTPWDTKIDLFSGGTVHQWKTAPAGTNKYCCPIDGSEFKTLIIPPSHIKKISHPVISQIINESLREIMSCRKIVFVGYSFPDADVHFKALFKKGLNNGQQIFVINRTLQKSLIMSYASLTDSVQFIESSFESLTRDSAFMQQIFH